VVQSLSAQVHLEQLTYNYVHIAVEMPLFSTNRGHIGGSNPSFTVSSAHSDAPKTRIGFE